ncbi:15-hydroxyprostaglandin dehydrogenase [NAD(+)]-like [Phlebotomus argentipes]|uniref:15-hydroxyprostaglandin dehydrogenase [NAD(+)]-like n=1 Tax=Phlebotomus argentipes TaxID=94469 RepID=UPI0028935807|nr:15-hydroxyprostaglandin dehydrogenase [NAD(+)]-like [Phlebotomus argentipes]
MDLKDKVALVTGAATGLGRSFCEEILRHGGKVSICDLDSDAGELAADELGQTFGRERVLFCHCDVTDYSQYEEAFQTTMTEFDAIDIVMNNAEIWNDKFWELEVDVNLNGTIRGTLLAQRFMGRNNGGSGGIVINIGSATSVRPHISTPIYSATKHAILALSRSCGDSYHFNLTGVRVVAVCPALLENAMASNSKRFKSPSHEKAWQLDVKGLMPQKLEHVARCVIPIIKDATSGSIWLIANGKSAKEIPYSAVQL